MCNKCRDSEYPSRDFPKLKGDDTIFGICNQSRFVKFAHIKDLVMKHAFEISSEDMTNLMEFKKSLSRKEFHVMMKLIIA